MRASVLYVGVVVAVGIGTLVAAASGWPASTPWPHWLAISVAVWLSSSLALRVPGAPITITVSETLVFITAIVFGWQPAAITVAVDGFVTSLRQRSVRLDRTAFNVAEPALSMAAAGFVLDWVSGLPPAQRVNATLVNLIVPAFAATSTYLFLNSCLMSVVVALESRSAILATWRRQVRWLLLDHMGATSLALLVVAGLRGSDARGLLVALPLLGALYVAFRSSVKRAEEALNYSERLNRLYLDTVESLATAIDAKDHVTHGHINRVRRFALRLADRLGVCDEATIKALEAGALLHDVGKLGVPDHILNKPGRLTPDEYEQVKRHAVIGAEIVSRVSYPYPVAPVVRHRHENWDGTGYPDGLRGEAIPLGARILAAVDCYDALTSDRPYRRAMSAGDALRIVLERRGSMYAPAVVDALVDLAGQGGLDAAPAPAVDRRAGPPARLLPPDERITSVQAASLTATATRTPAEDCRGVMARLTDRLMASTGASTLALFVPAGTSGLLRPAWTAGRAAAQARILVPEIGRGLSGWVAAHRVALCNTSADLEFQDATDPTGLPRHTVSVPVDFQDGATGALTLYGDDTPFAEEVPALARTVAEQLRRCTYEPGPDALLPPPAESTASSVVGLVSLPGVTRESLAS